MIGLVIYPMPDVSTKNICLLTICRGLIMGNETSGSKRWLFELDGWRQARQTTDDLEKRVRIVTSWNSFQATFCCRRRCGLVRACVHNAGSVAIYCTVR